MRVKIFITEGLACIRQGFLDVESDGLHREMDPERGNTTLIITSYRWPLESRFQDKR
jgi:hypothetical protein